MRKLLKYPFLIVLLISVLAAMPFVWKRLGLINFGTPAEAHSGHVCSDDPHSPPETVPETSGPEADSSAFPPIEHPFEGALLIGDSRTVGIWEYAHLEGADFFAKTNLCVSNVFNSTTYAGGIPDCTLKGLLSEKSYERIFIMLGINDLGTEPDITAAKYDEMVGAILEIQPETCIILQANLHVTDKRSGWDKIFSNERIDELNGLIRDIADRRHMRFLDPNEFFDDENHGLNPEMTFDDVHLFGDCYPAWADWIENSLSGGE